MRITCPNCQAQYDIDPAMIPAAGRDVQCSNCAHTWLELGPHAPKRSEDVQPDEDLDTAAREEGAETTGVDQEEEVDGALDAPLEDTLAEAAESTFDAPEASPSDETDPEPTADAQDAAPMEDGADKIRTALDRPKSEEIEPEPQSEDLLADVREALADPSSDTPPPSPDPQAEDGDAAALAVAEAVAATAGADIDESETEPLGDADTETKAEDDSAVTDEAGSDDAEPLDADAAALDDTAIPALDDDIAGILREEAEREVTQRRSEDPPALEAQAELGLGEEPPSEVLRERLDRMRGDGVPQTTVAQTLATATATPLDGPRRERLPDIEEIKTSLRPSDIAVDDEAPIGASEMNRIRQRGFRRGFATLVIAAGVLVAAYVFAPQIIDLIPATERAMMAYVETANSVRDGIDVMMARAITGLEGIGGGA